jgi:hypothetical protein
LWEQNKGYFFVTMWDSTSICSWNNER